MCQLAKVVYVIGRSEGAEELDWLIGDVSEGMRRPDGNDDVVANLGVPMAIAKGEPEDAAGYEKSLIVHEVAMLPRPRDASRQQRCNRADPVVGARSVLEYAYPCWTHLK